MITLKKEQESWIIAELKQKNIWWIFLTNKIPISEVQFIFLYKKTKEIQHKMKVQVKEKKTSFKQ